MLRASLGKVVHTVQRAGTFAAKVSPQELHKIAVHVRAVVLMHTGGFYMDYLIWGRGCGFLSGFPPFSFKVSSK
jgi:hypothetical protein